MHPTQPPPATVPCAQLSVHQGGVEHGHEHLYDTVRYGSRLTIELSASYQWRRDAQLSITDLDYFDR